MNLPKLFISDLDLLAGCQQYCVWVTLVVANSSKRCQSLSSPQTLLEE
jgi:hypothetical protein